MITSEGSMIWKLFSLFLILWMMSEWLKSIFIPVGFSKRREKFVQWPENPGSAEGWCFAKPRVLQKKNGGFPEQPAQTEGHCHERGGQEGGGNRIRTGTPPDGNRRDLSKQPNQNNAVHSTIPQDQGVHCTGKVSRVFSSGCKLTEIKVKTSLFRTRAFQKALYDLFKEAGNHFTFRWLTPEATCVLIALMAFFLGNQNELLLSQPISKLTMVLFHGWAAVYWAIAIVKAGTFPSQWPETGMFEIDCYWI